PVKSAYRITRVRLVTRRQNEMVDGRMTRVRHHRLKLGDIRRPHHSCRLPDPTYRQSENTQGIRHGIVVHEIAIDNSRPKRYTSIDVARSYEERGRNSILSQDRCCAKIVVCVTIIEGENDGIPR